MHLARAEHEQRLRRRADVLAALEHQRTHAFRQLVPPGQRHVNRDAARAQRLREAIGDGLAGASIPSSVMNFAIIWVPLLL